LTSVERAEQTQVKSTVHTTDASKPYTRCVLVLGVAWATGACLSWAAFRLNLIPCDPDLLTLAGIGSGLITLMASIPGVLIEWRSTAGEDPARITIGFFIGVVIRIAGTVALAALCRYHLPAAKGQIAGAILVWYVYLTAVDVTTLALLLPRQDRRELTRSQNAKPSVQ
jgi:hypothetical protein